RRYCNLRVLDGTNIFVKSLSSTNKHRSEQTFTCTSYQIRFHQSGPKWKCDEVADKRLILLTFLGDIDFRTYFRNEWFTESSVHMLGSYAPDSVCRGSAANELPQCNLCIFAKSALE